MCENDFIKCIKDLEDYHFTIEKYQRGYKWTPRQVLELLEDINASKSPYCLQPLAVKKIEKDEKIENHYEVIDGQQRLTTLYMILKALNKNDYFEINYKTRERSGKFLEKIETRVAGFHVEYSSDYNDFVKNIDDQWKEFVNKNKEENNIDNYYFFSAYFTIKAWVEKEVDKENFKTKLLDNTFFIWYNDTTSKTAEEIFRNLNSGKISLTNAELIKSLFITQKYTYENNKELQELKRQTFAREWDMIEQNLQDNSFWFFINNDTNENRYQTRIDFLFELITGKSDNNNQDYWHSYRQYADNLKKENGENKNANRENEYSWEQIKKNYLTLKEWYNNRYLYHLIGFIVSKDFKKIQNLINDSKDKTKSKLQEDLIKLVKNKIDWKEDCKANKEMLQKLVFTETKDKIHNILLLFNIAEYYKIDSFRFPFDKYKNTKWSLEHIFAQKTENFKTRKEIQAWIDEAKKIAEELENKEEINNKFYEIKLPNREEDFAAKKNEIIKKLQPIIDLFDKEMHNLSNMALLDSATNSGLGNNQFPEKRKYIIENQHKHFIPLATLNVFLKYYTKEIKQMEFWGQKDREDYLDAITNSIDDFLTFKNC